MKKKLTLTIIGIVTSISSMLYAQPISAQSRTAAFVKILPTTQSGVIKVLHAQESESPVLIKFTTQDGEVGQDQVVRSKYEKGFTKKYDVSKIQGKDFWIEVTTAETSVTYHIVTDKKKKTFDAYLEKISYDHTVASNN